MKIIKYKKLSNNRYELILENNNSYKLYEETILYFNLLISKELDINNINEINRYDLKYKIYYDGINILKHRFKSSKELYDILINKDYDIELVKEIIDILIKQGYLNDRSYCKSYINNQIISNLKGPNKIKNELIMKGISKDIIDDEIIIFTNDIIIEKVNKIISKELKLNKNKGGLVLKNKIISYLISLGYELNNFSNIINSYSFNVSKDIVDREYLKLYKKYSKKYSGNELDYIIKKNLYQKGLFYED